MHGVTVLRLSLLHDHPPPHPADHVQLDDPPAVIVIPFLRAGQNALLSVADLVEHGGRDHHSLPRN